MSKSTIEANESTREPKEARRFWSAEEESRLRKAYGISETFSIETIAREFGRSENAIATKANELGICHPNRNKSLVVRQAMSVSRKGKPNKYKGIPLWADKPHPRGMKGKTHTVEARAAISRGNKGRKVPAERVLRQCRTRVERQGALCPNVPRGNWKSGWRTIAERKIYARSRWEANYARYLQFLKQNGDILQWEHEPETFWFEAIKRGCRSYLPDFRVTTKSGAIEYHEVKGWMDDRSKTKIRRMAKYHPSIVLIIKDGKWFAANRIKLSGLVAGWER